MERTKNLCYYVDKRGHLSEKPLENMMTVYVNLIHDLRYGVTYDRSDYFPAFNGAGSMLPMEEYFGVFFCPSHFYFDIEGKIRKNKEEGKETNLRVVFRRVVTKYTLQHYPRRCRDLAYDDYGLYVKEAGKGIYEHPDSIPKGKTEDVNILFINQ